VKFIADFHIHSKYSRATSKQLNPENLDHWSKIKGIQVMGTGDCLHPGWFQELQEKFEQQENGFYILKDKFKLQQSKVHKTNPTQFILTTEISTIYKKGGKVRKVHSLCVFPNFRAAKKAYDRLSKIGNMNSDGRPILGLDTKHLLEIVLESDPGSYLIPAHIWTPWFSMLGSKSGFDSIEECFDDLAEHIFAVETGLSSDPPMNRACSFLDNVRLISNSDAHSLEKLGREANMFDTELSYQSVLRALKEDDGFLGTIEFYPQEGKYHYDGHRKCKVVWNPLETIEHNGVCPVCHKPITKGVMYRVAELADTAVNDINYGKQDFYSITPLAELLAEIALTKSTKSKKVEAQYFQLINQFQSEFNILLFEDLNNIREQGFGLVAEGISRLRNGEVHIEEGYDGEFGKIKVFKESEVAQYAKEALFVNASFKKSYSKVDKNQSVEFDIPAFQALLKNKQAVKAEDTLFDVLEFEADEFRDGAQHLNGPCLVLAGPGAGKTRLLIERIYRLITDYNVSPNQILAITFTNKAAGEIKKRLLEKLPQSKVETQTFHGFGLSVLRRYAIELNRKFPFKIIDADEQLDIIEKLLPGQRKLIKKALKQIESYKQGLDSSDLVEGFNSFFYGESLEKNNAFDLQDLIYLPVKLWQKRPDILAQYKGRYKYILVDEFQDINPRQYELLKMLSGYKTANLFAIGDPDQAIYGFRGADVGLISQLKDDYPLLKEVRLKRSFRCPENILKVAGQVLKKKKALKGKKDEINVDIKECVTGKSEADYVATQIEKLIGGTRSFSMDSGITDGTEFDGISNLGDIAVLLRTTNLFPAFIEAFNNHGIPYQIISSQPFFKKEKIWTTLMQIKNIYHHLDDELEKLSPELELSIRKAIDKKYDLEVIVTKGFSNIEIHISDYNQLISMVKKYGHNYADFFQDLYLYQPADELKEKSQAVSLMTIHASKGLEFQAVFIPGCEEKIIPYELYNTKTSEELAEEARLFYVGITRTKKYLYLSHAKKRFLQGRSLDQSPTRFLNNLSEEYLDVSQRENKKKLQQMNLFK
jgi:DNA helicase II / ATP-dependent DNA helicase PcrA